MQIDKFLAWANGPDKYEFPGGDVVRAYYGGESEDFDLSGLAEGDEFEGVEPATIDLPGEHILQDAYRDEQGELHVTLCQRTPDNVWEESGPVNSSEYDPQKRYIKNVG